MQDPLGWSVLGKPGWEALIDAWFCLFCFSMAIAITVLKQDCLLVLTSL